MTKNVRILEATIRDGGYMVNHHFSRTDLATIVGTLDSAGLPYLEVGHGNGVGSHLFRDPKLRGTSMPLVDDTGHAEVALRVAQHARVGVVLTAGSRFSPPEYIDRIAELGFHFVRLAVMPDEIDDALYAYVRRLKDRGLLASINMMQTYAKTPAQVGVLAKGGADAGADWFYVVDSAGGMTVDEVKRYVSAILEAAPVEVGLHAHNNLGCAVANGLAAVEAGATLVDGTLNGIGRATGNPATEQLAVALRDRLAHDVELDTLVALSNAIRSLFEDTGNDPNDFVSGGALVHSRNVPKVFEAARKRGRARSAFLLGVGSEARRRGVINAMAYSDELYDTVAERTPNASRIEATDAMVAITSQEILARHAGGARRAIEDLSLLGKQRHLESVVHVSRAAAALCARPVPWQGAAIGVTIPSIESGDAGAWSIEPDHLPDYVLADDDDREPPIRGKVATWRVPFGELYARAVQELCVALRNRGFTIWCPDPASARLLGALPHVTGSRPEGLVALLLGNDDPDITRLAAGDVGVQLGAMQRARVDLARRRGARIVLPHWPATVAQIADTLVRYHRELGEAAPADGLVSGCDAAGAGQSRWDPERATLLDAEDPAEAARHAGAAYLAAILGGARRL